MSAATPSTIGPLHMAFMISVKSRSGSGHRTWRRRSAISLKEKIMPLGFTAGDHANISDLGHELTSAGQQPKSDLPRKRHSITAHSANYAPCSRLISFVNFLISLRTNRIYDHPFSEMSESRSRRLLGNESVERTASNASPSYDRLRRSRVPMQRPR